jgi:hypothetical protein
LSETPVVLRSVNALLKLSFVMAFDHSVWSAKEHDDTASAMRTAPSVSARAGVELVGMGRFLLWCPLDVRAEKGKRERGRRRGTLRWGRRRPASDSRHLGVAVSGRTAAYFIPVTTVCWQRHPNAKRGYVTFVTDSSAAARI